MVKRNMSCRISLSQQGLLTERRARVVIETMGYEDSDYCARKSRQHTGMKQIGVLHTDPPKWLDNDHPPFEKHMYGVFMHLRY